MGTSEQTRGSRRWKELTIIKTIIGVAPGIIFLAFGLSAEAQQPRKLARVGYLSSAGPITRGYRIDAFRQGLKELGYIEGKNIIIEYRFAEAKSDRLPELARELIGLKVDIIFARGTPAPEAAKNATHMIPIVTSSAEPIESGLSLAWRNREETLPGWPTFPPS
jgi:putative ABC transport system substrate-binding protein